MKKLSEKLTEKLISYGYNLKSPPVKHYTNANLREAGAWRWSALSDYGRIGSCYTMKECLDSKKLTFYKLHYIDTEVFPE